LRYLLLVLVALSLHAEDINDILGGFDDDVSVDVAQKSSPITGSYSIFGSYSYSHDDDSPHHGLSSLKNSVDIEYNEEIDNTKLRASISTYYDMMYTLNGSDTYQDEYTKDKKELEIKELYALSKLSKNIDLKVGRQIITWGKSDNIVVTDILNPLDKRKLALNDIKDVKLSQTMSKLDYYIGNLNISAIAIHENRVSKLAPYGSDYNFAKNSIIANKPSNSIADTKPALAINYTGSGYDISAYYANKYSDTGHIQNNKREYNSYHMYGLSTNIAKGNWLIKLESALMTNLKYTNVDDKKRRVDILLGLEYKGISDTTISFESARRKIYDYDKMIASGIDGQKEIEYQSAFRINRDIANSTIHLTYLANFFNRFDSGGFQRASVDYDYSDDIILSLGLVDYYGSTNKKFSNLDSNDRVYARAKYLF
jgi:hypothetical protein